MLFLMTQRARIIRFINTRRENVDAHGHVDHQPDHETIEVDEHEPNRRSTRARKEPERFGNPIPSSLIN